MRYDLDINKKSKGEEEIQYTHTLRDIACLSQKRREECPTQ